MSLTRGYEMLVEIGVEQDGDIDCVMGACSEETFGICICEDESMCSFGGCSSLAYKEAL